MNREIEKLLSEKLEYLGSDVRRSNGDELTQWRLPNGEVIEIIVLENYDREMKILEDNRNNNNESPYGKGE